MITVNAQEAKSRLPALLTAVEDTVEPDPLLTHPELMATILYDPTEPASEDEWPGEFR